MDFTISKSASMVGYTTDDGRKGYYPTYHIDIDGECIADEYREHSLTPDVIAHVIEESENEISEAISRIIAANIARNIVSPTRVRVESSTELQVWVGDLRDYADYVKDEVFDCELALDTFTLDELPPSGDGFADGACNFGDDVFDAAVSLGLTDEWSGPFCFRISDYPAYDRYIAARVKNEYGYELRN